MPRSRLWPLQREVLKPITRFDARERRFLFTMLAMAVAQIIHAWETKSLATRNFAAWDALLVLFLWWRMRKLWGGKALRDQAGRKVGRL